MNRNSILNIRMVFFWSDMSIENASYILLNEILVAINRKQMVGEISWPPKGIWLLITLCYRRNLNCMEY
jgi:hypothetical protein